ncbi:GDP-mannose 4,6-dehydratase [Salinigranum halophilum]|jgi:UDP-glucose 4-epimerase|uniref:GDP-mannose 4,6-dehydratase n=1 Tax=Salinigranum halophilum TaxID=2565931 RepID=UPI00115F1C89|nr:NAD-dependent epimerase/dehydratase family protein [Salinigranum halophilum]
MEILVTGGAGFIGGHLSARFISEGYSVVALDEMHPYYDLDIKRHTIDQCERLAAETDGAYEFVEGDIRDSSLVSQLVKTADYVYHQAGRAGVRDSVAEPRVYNEVNVDGTLNILDSAREWGIERMVMASSSSVYGGREEYLPFGETDPTLPVSPYGASKLAAERYLCSYHQVYDLPTVALRYFTVYGPRMRPNMAISNFVSRCTNGDPPVVYGDGTQTRDFTFVDDIVDANVSLLSTDCADGEALNIGSADNIAIRDLATEIRDQIDPELELEYADRYAADADHTHADITKAAKLIGYDPNHTISEGVTKFIEWYQANRDWYEPLVLSS